MFFPYYRNNERCKECDAHSQIVTEIHRFQGKCKTLGVRCFGKHSRSQITGLFVMSTLTENDFLVCVM
jgi:hypothetical protein